MARRWKLGRDQSGVAKIVIWNDEWDNSPFENPLGNADRVKFSTTFNYTRVVDKRTVWVTFPQANGGGLRVGTINLFAHGRGGQPRVRGNITINGYRLSLGCHVPVQHYVRPVKPLDLQGTFRLAIIGATSTDVIIAWSVDLSNMTSDGFLPQITLPVTVEVTNEFN